MDKSPATRILDLKKAAQQSFQQGFLALFAPDGRRLDPADSLESANLGKEETEKTLQSNAALFTFLVHFFVCFIHSFVCLI